MATMCPRFLFKPENFFFFKLLLHSLINVTRSAISIYKCIQTKTDLKQFYDIYIFFFLKMSASLFSLSFLAILTIYLSCFRVIFEYFDFKRHVISGPHALNLSITRSGTCLSQLSLSTACHD